MTSLARAQFEAFRHRESVGAKVYLRQGYHRHIISTNLSIKYNGSVHATDGHGVHCIKYTNTTVGETQTSVAPDTKE